MLHRQPELLERFAPRWRLLLPLGIVLVLPAREGVGWVRELGWIQAPGSGVRWLHATVYALMMWSFVLGFLGLFVRFRRHPSPVWRYVADASYWIYLDHLPLVVWLQVWMARWPWPWTAKYPLILAICFPLLFLSYHFLVRGTFIGARLNGRRYPLRRYAK
jgi:hypothetical protein